MRIIRKDLRHGEITLRPDSADDLWYLSQAIEKGDHVKSRTLRKIKIGNEDDRKSEVFKKEVTVTLLVERSELVQPFLRVSGTITEAPEDIPRGSHHTISLEQGSTLTIIKEHWLQFQLDRINDAAESKGPKILACIFDREQAIFAMLNQQGYEILSEIAGNVAKKAVEKAVAENFYTAIIKQIKEYDLRHKPDRIILASPAFWKEELMKELTDEGLRKKIVPATCSIVDRSAVDEVLKRPELKEVLRQERVSKESLAVESLLAEISKSGKAAYGLKDTEKSVESGAVETLLVTDKLIQKARLEQYFGKIDYLMRTSEKLSAKVMILNSENEPGRKLDGLGGIAALLRYKVNY